jgi:hypothetical protein
MAESIAAPGTLGDSDHLPIPPRESVRPLTARTILFPLVHHDVERVARAAGHLSLTATRPDQL